MSIDNPARLLIVSMSMLFACLSGSHAASPLTTLGLDPAAATARC